MEPNNFGTTDGGMLTSLSCVEGYFLVVSLQEKLVRILFTTQVRDLVIPELKLLYTPVPWKFYVHSDKHPARRKKATRRRLVQNVQTVHRHRTKWVGYSMSKLWRLCYDKHQNKVITVTGDDQIHRFHRLSFPFLHVYSPPQAHIFYFSLLIFLSTPL